MKACTCGHYLPTCDYCGRNTNGNSNGPTRLEEIAARLGQTPDQLRDRLWRAIVETPEPKRG